MTVNIAIYGSHDSSLCIKIGEEYRIYEFERLTRVRNYNLNKTIHSEGVLRDLKRIIEQEYGAIDVENCYICSVDFVKSIQAVFSPKNIVTVSHHIAHASGGLWQSKHDRALIISSDGGGWDADGSVKTFGVFIGDKKHGITPLAYPSIDVCSPYTLMAVPISEIWKGDVFSAYLTYAGKIMGLSAYGKKVDKWIPFIQMYYQKLSNNEQYLKELGEQIGLDFSKINTLSGEQSADLSYNSQLVFEELTMNTILPFIMEHNNLPIILVGGGALNVLMNEKIRKFVSEDVFVPCNPNDCGLSFGMLCLNHPPSDYADIRYNGFGLLDGEVFENRVSEYNAQKPLRPEKFLSDKIAEGKIIGVVMGNSECGARALGNRSILCNPAISGMKDKLNKIKHREYFRPFAPICKLEEVSTYFETDKESPFMSFAPKVRGEYRDKISAVTHNDGTARVQTVTENENPFLYKLLTKLKANTNVGVVLNTSFNIKGQPILTRIDDALQCLKETELDGVFINGYYFSK